MKKFLMAIVLVFTTVVSTAAFAEEQVAPAVSSPKDITITNEMLLNMSDTTRNSLFSEMKKMADPVGNALPVEVKAIAAGIDVVSFRAKALAIADTLVDFCKKLGITVNEFITTPAGMFIIFAALYKMGIFGSIFGLAKLVFILLVCSYTFVQLNIRKKIELTKKDAKGEIVSYEEVLVPKFSGIFERDSEGETVYATVGSIIMVFIMIVSIINL